MKCGCHLSWIQIHTYNIRRLTQGLITWLTSSILSLESKFEPWMEPIWSEWCLVPANSNFIPNTFISDWRWHLCIPLYHTNAQGSILVLQVDNDSITPGGQHRKKNKSQFYQTSPKRWWQMAIHPSAVIGVPDVNIHRLSLLNLSIALNTVHGVTTAQNIVIQLGPIHWIIKWWMDWGHKMVDGLRTQLGGKSGGGRTVISAGKPRAWRFNKAAGFLGCRKVYSKSACQRSSLVLAEHESKKVLRQREAQRAERIGCSSPM